MFYFVPSWYNQSRPWYHNTQLWFRILERMTFDDTINQMKMFHQAEEEVRLMVLNYQPQFRYDLHKQGLLQTPYWSFFDDIQNISRLDVHPLNFKDLNWPENVQFLYSPFAVLARQEKKDLATIHFAQDGNLFYIEFIEDGRIRKQYLFDDRGFLSSILYFDEQGRELHQDYLNESGIWQVREHLKPHQLGRIEVNSDADHSFQQRYYGDWPDLLRERLLLLHQQEMQPEDTLVVASHEQHNDLLLDVFLNQKKVFSFFGERYPLDLTESSQRLLKQANLLVVDQKKQEEELRQLMQAAGQQEKELLRVSPYDTRLRLGHSQMLKEQVIYFYIDNLDSSEIREILGTLLEFMDRHEDVNLFMVSFDRNLNFKNWEDWITSHIHEKYDPDDFFQVVDTGNENQLEEDELMELSRVTFHLFTNENEIITALDSTRLLLDLGPEPDLYTQIASISAGVPQINRVETDFVSHEKNGWVLSPEADLEIALRYYLEGLANWNRSFVYTVQKMADYTSGRILAQWQQLLNKDQ
ncbi:accessory Sec system protein Asp1 [Streptococcus sp. NLN76]|uniref:accessory Sec system protein Asp1 n=1 Tax=Streptococcus sp. NLN76 TaxID=2822800 RepID=UPI0018A9DAFB|nr:accessory Sec system protein Asp1 [Streptococcus sp. NLN76]MBF8970460.1 accessory Sec system protein Asp1 [Streptococcus sp. NLN76]